MIELSAGGVARDFTAVRQDLLRLARELLPEWTYQGSDDFGVVLVELMAYMADHLHYRVDATLRDLRPLKTPYRDLAREMAEWMGYQARRPAAARSIVTLTLASASTRPVSLPRAFRFSCQNEGQTVFFESLAEAIVPAGNLEIDLECEEGVTELQAVIGTATGEPFERFLLPADTLFAWNDTDLEVLVGGRPAVHRRYMATAVRSELAYAVRQQRDGRLLVIFGDGTYGARLPAGQPVTCTYRRGGGRVGNVTAGAIDTVVSRVRDWQNNVIDATCTNANWAQGGTPAETLDSIRMQVPAHFRAQDRCVSLGDYVVETQKVAGVLQAAAAAAGVNGVRIFVVPDGAGESTIVTPVLRRRILRHLESRQMATDAVAVLPATIVPVDISLQVTALPNYRRSAVLAAVRAVFEGAGGLLAQPRTRLGQSQRISDAVRAVDELDGTDYVETIKHMRRPQLRWISRSGSADLSGDVTVTSRTKAQIWRIEFFSAPEDAEVVRFTVTGSIDGLQVNEGELDVAYTSDTGEIGFTVAAGDLAMAAGDAGEIVVSVLAGSFTLQANEFPVLGSLEVVVDGGID